MPFKRRSDADVRASLDADIEYIDHMEFTPYSCSEHTPIAGMMHVHPEDLDSVTAARSVRGEKVNCNDCDSVYTIKNGWVTR